MQSSAKTVAAYLTSLPPDRRATISALRDLILKHLPKGYVETMNWGMICYEIPLSVYPITYNKQPIGIAALASQKNYCSLYLTCAYTDAASLAALEKAFADANLKPDMGKCCIRFQNPADLPLKHLAKLIAATPPKKIIQLYERSRKPATRGKC